MAPPIRAIRMGAMSQREWSRADATWRAGFVAGIKLAAGDLGNTQLRLAFTDGQVALDDLDLTAPAARERGEPA